LLAADREQRPASAAEVLERLEVIRTARADIEKLLSSDESATLEFKSVRARAIGIWSGVSGLAVAIGPVCGGLLLRHFSWSSVFYVSVPVAVVALIAGRFLLPESRDPKAGCRVTRWHARPGRAASVTAVTPGAPGFSDWGRLRAR
jgi:MFS family permease